MALETLPAIGSALAQTFSPTLAKQWNRSAVLAALVSAKTSAGQGKNVAFDTEFSGATAATVAEGSDVAGSEFTSDVNVPAVLAWAHYRSSFNVSETEIDAAASSLGTPEALVDLFGDRILGCGAKIGRLISTDMITGTGVDGSGNPQIVGLLGGALETTGNYAGINRAAYSEWGGNVLGNSAVLRPLTMDLLYNMDQLIFAASGEPYTHIITSPGVFRKYAGLFEAGRAANASVTSGAGGIGDPAQYSTGALSFKGIPVLRDPQVTAGRVIFINVNQMAVKYLPRALARVNDAVGAQMAGINGGNGMNAVDVTQIPMRIALLAKSGDSIKVSLKVTLAMGVMRPNACGYVTDISES